VWAVGQSDDAAHEAFPLIEHLSHGTWTAQLPAGLGSGFSDSNGVAVTGGTVWLAGGYLDAATGLQHTLLARSAASGWQQVPAPNPGTGDKTLGGISAAGTSAWTVGYFKTDTGRSPLIEVHKSR
jgi:hypothetical protein